MIKIKMHSCEIPFSLQRASNSVFLVLVLKRAVFFWKSACTFGGSDEIPPSCLNSAGGALNFQMGSVFWLRLSRVV